ncbi:hypothetical protein PG985_006487 [Apiospora marii]|uniref:Uncharacterized protein n=1 Tax=Apiospora marii TaxID=335849 RepID=A0ABR1S7R5_9PEZI
MPVQAFCGSATVWSLLEMSLGTACVCMTRLKPFLGKYLSHLVFPLVQSQDNGGDLINKRGLYHKQNKSTQRGRSPPAGWWGDGNDELIMMTDVTAARPRISAARTGSKYGAKIGWVSRPHDLNGEPRKPADTYDVAEAGLSQDHAGTCGWP